MGRVSNKNQHLKKIAQLSVKSRQEDKNHKINSANELIDNEMLVKIMIILGQDF